MTASAIRLLDSPTLSLRPSANCSTLAALAAPFRPRCSCQASASSAASTNFRCNASSATTTPVSKGSVRATSTTVRAGEVTGMPPRTTTSRGVSCAGCTCRGPGSSPTTADCPADVHRTSDRRPTGQSVQRRCGQVADDRGAVQLGIRSIHQHHMPMPWQHGFVLFGRSVRPRQSTITTPSFFSRRSCRTVVPCRRTSARWNTAGLISRCSLMTPIRHPVFARDDARPPDVDSWKYVHKLSIRPAEA